MSIAMKNLRFFKIVTTFKKSEVPPEPDCLSSCHLLVSILRFLDYSDILNCRLVNHRINELIQKNQKAMPRRKADLLIQYFNCDEPHALVYLTTNVKHFYMISARRITIWKSRNPGIRQVDAHFYLYGIPVAMNELSGDEAITMKTVKDFYGYQCTITKCYRISSIEEGLRAVLRILFSLFYFREMSFPLLETTEEIANALLGVVIEEFKGSGCVCCRMVPIWITPRILELIDVTGCRRLSPFMEDANIKEIFPKLPLNKIDELILLSNIDSFHEVVELVRGMLSRSHRVSYIRLRNARNVIIANYHDLFLTAIKSNFLISSISKPSLFRLLFDKRNNDEAIEIERSGDGKMIKIRCSGKELHLSAEKAF